MTSSIYRDGFQFLAIVRGRSRAICSSWLGSDTEQIATWANISFILDLPLCVVLGTSLTFSSQTFFSLKATLFPVRFPTSTQGGIKKRLREGVVNGGLMIVSIAIGLNFNKGFSNALWWQRTQSTSLCVLDLQWFFERALKPLIKPLVPT